MVVLGVLFGVVVWRPFFACEGESDGEGKI